MDSLGDFDSLINKIHFCDALDLLRALPKASVDMILTDFPYNKTAAHYDRHELDLEAYKLEMFRVIKEKGAVISTSAQPFTSRLITAWDKYFRYEWIWRKTRKTNFLNAPYEPLSAHEAVLVFGHKRPNYYPQMIKGKLQDKSAPANRGGELYGDMQSLSGISDLYYPDTVLEFAHDAELSKTNKQNPDKLGNHPNQKPLKLWEFLLLSYTQENNIVLDCFSGSGVTAVASSNLNRRFIVGDNHLPYVELSRDRLKRNLGQSYVKKNGETQTSLFDLLESD